MRLLIIAALLTMTVLATVCLADETPSTSLVNQAGFAAYYTNVDDALKAAKADQFVVLEFYTDW